MVWCRYEARKSERVELRVLHRKGVRAGRHAIEPEKTVRVGCGTRRAALDSHECVSDGLSAHAVIRDAARVRPDPGVADRAALVIP